MRARLLGRPAAKPFGRPTPALLRRPSAWLLVLAALAWILPGADEAVAEPTEYEVKAAFLYNFARFVEWPDPGPPDRPFVIDVIGADPFGTALDEAVRGKDIGGHPVEVRRATGAAGLAGCALAFVAVTDRDELVRLLGEAERASVLTVGETRDFARLGGMITFVNKEATIGFEINNRAANLAGLNVSSKLLRVAAASAE